MNEEDLINIFTNYFNKKYDYLIEVANNVLQKYNRQHLKYDLVHHCVDWVYAHPTKIIKYIDDDTQSIEKYCVRFIQNNAKWSKSPFNVKYLTNNLNDEEFDILDESPINIDHDEEDYLSSILSTEDMHKVYVIKKIIDTFPIHQRTLYEDYFVSNLSLRDLSKKYNISTGSAFNLLKTFKNKIKNKLNIQTDEYTDDK
jgi:hypothetical protein